MLIDLKIVPVEGADFVVPTVQTKYSACADIAVCLNHVEYVQCWDSYNRPSDIEVETSGDNEPFIKIYPGERVMIPTGMQFIIPHGYQIKIIPRSGIPLKTGLMELNSPGTIDSDYTKEVMALVVNTSDVVLTIKHHDRIAQMEIRENTMQFVRFASGTEDELNAHNETSNRTGGFGSTGK